MSRADYDYEMIDGNVYIYDLNKGNKSVTNDIENVLAEIESVEGSIASKRIFYFDSEMELAEIIGWPDSVFFMPWMSNFYTVNTLYKWNYETQEYDEMENVHEVAIHLPNDYLTRCANCGNELFYGHTYASKVWHNRIGIGYGVCEKCSRAEWKVWRKYGF